MLCEQRANIGAWLRSVFKARPDCNEIHFKMLKCLLLSTLCGLAWSQTNLNDVAFIVGGVIDEEPVKRSASAEIFGCPGQENIKVDDFPKEIYYSAGVQWGNDVVICGGIAVEGEFIDQDECFAWNVETGWQPFPSLTRKRFNFLMALGPNLHKPWNSSQLAPIAMDERGNAEIFDLDFMAWVPYKTIGGNGMSASTCLVQWANMVYFFDRDNQINALDLNTWDVSVLGTVPLEIQAEYGSGRCAFTYYNGSKGKEIQSDLDLTILNLTINLSLTILILG